jgi:hypothetical protein
MAWWTSLRWRKLRVLSTADSPTPARESAPEDDAGWRSAWALAPGSSLGGTERDLAPGDWRGLLLEAYEAYCTNPLAYAVIEQSVNFVLGGGVRAVAREPRVQQAIDRFWHDPENRMDQRVYAIQTELSLFGEQFLRFFVDPLTGRVVLRQLDPLYVEAIETDPEDIERPLRYLYRPPRSPGQVAALSGAARAGASAGLEGEWIGADEVLHVAINKVSNALRGRSDLAPLLPWLRRYRDWLTDRVRQNRYKGAFLWDVTVTGADRAQLERLRADYALAPPEPGSVLFHNEAETWRAVQPVIGAGDVRDDGRAIRLMIAAGAMLPEHYLSEGGNANRATAAEMGLPAIKRQQRRQEQFRQFLVAICRRVVEEGVRHGALGPRVRRELSIQFEELSPAPLEQQALAARQVADALSVASDRGWVTAEEARVLWWRYAGAPEVALGTADAPAVPSPGGAG